MRQTGVVSEDVINTVKTHISRTYIKTRDIGLLGKKVGLNFLVHKPDDRPSRQGKIKLEKLGQKKNNYLIWAKPLNDAKARAGKPIELLWHENHWMLYEEGIRYNDEIYNTFRFL